MKRPIQLSDHFTYRKLLQFVFPSIVMMIFTSIYGVVDGLFVSNFAGKTAFASINLIMPFLIILGAMGFMLGTGGTALVSRVLGEGDKEHANKYFSMITLFGILLGVILTVVGVLAMRPRCVVLDEPTAGLDPMGRELILGQIREYHRETGSTILLVSHSMEDIANYAGKALVMNDGSLYMYDDVEKVFSHQKEIAEMGLSVPQVARIFTRLAEKGYPVNPNVFRVEDAVAQIRELIRKGENLHA